MQQLNETADQLDISIENLEKKPKVLQLKMGDTVTVTEKIDGTKLTIIRNSAEYDPTSAEANWIVSYKNNIINSHDFAGLTAKHDDAIKRESSGISQYKFVWDGLRKAHKNCKGVPPNTEFFVEFMMRKATLTRTYDNYHHMLLIASSPTQYRIQSGKVYSTPRSFDTTHNEHYAKTLSLMLPKILYKGPFKKLITALDPVQMVEQLRTKFMDLQSQFGGVMEGVVFEFSDGTVYKLVQSDQYSKETRSAVKAKFEPTDPGTYWDSVRSHAETHAGSNATTADISKKVYGGPDLKLDKNRTSIQAKDDVFLTAKNILMRKSPGNNGVLFLGRFSPLTIAHHKIIEDAIKKYDTVTVNVVKSKIDIANPFPVEVQLKMLKLCFGDKIEVIVSATGNLATILQKSKHNINVILAGTDRVAGYTEQMKRDKDVKVLEIPRTDSVSGTLVRKFIRDGNLAEFKKYTPQEVWSMFGDLKKHVDSL